MSAASSHILYPILLFASIIGGAFADKAFIHPGLLHSQADLDRMKVAVAQKRSPIFEGFKVLSASPQSQASYRRLGPFPEIGRAPTIRMGEAKSDAEAAYQNALMWTITCLLYTSPSPRDGLLSRMPSSA